MQTHSFTQCGVVRAGDGVLRRVQRRDTASRGRMGLRQERHSLSINSIAAHGACARTAAAAVAWKSPVLMSRSAEHPCRWLGNNSRNHYRPRIILRAAALSLTFSPSSHRSARRPSLARGSSPDSALPVSIKRSAPSSWSRRASLHSVHRRVSPRRRTATRRRARTIRTRAVGPIPCRRCRCAPPNPASSLTRSCHLA